MPRVPAVPFTAAAFVALLRSQRGVTEHPAGSNRTPYGADQGIDGQPWCAAFDGWAFDRLAGRRGAWRAFWAALGCDTPYYTPALVAAARRAGLTVSRTTTRAGDLLFWDFPDSVHRVQHVDVAVGPFNGSHVVTIGGNTSSSAAGSQSNGGGVFERVRTASSLVAVVRLPFTTTRSEDDMPDAKELAAAMADVLPDKIAAAILAAPVAPRAVDSPGTVAGALYRDQSEAMRVADQLRNLGELIHACSFGDKAGADQAIALMRARDVVHPGEQEAG